MWQKEDFFEYKTGMELTDFPKDKVPLLQMEHLRQMDIMITRGISYERTAYTFLAQIELNDQMHVFKDFPYICVLLNEEGAVIRHDGSWDLIFTPDKLEGNTLAEDAPMLPVLERIVEDTKNGSKCWITLREMSIKGLMSNRQSFNILDAYCTKYPGGYLAVAEKVVIEGTDELFRNVPVCRYGNLTTVDLEERESYDSIKVLMDEYIYAVNNSGGNSVRPLSIAVFGAPGSGKSFGVKQIAKSFGCFDVSTLNLSQYNSYEEMLVALDTALNASKHIPLIFFDEFDSEYNGNSRGWLKFLLAPMQDGEYTLNGKIISIKHAVFVFAGGTASSFNKFLPTTEEETAIFKAVKGPDFVSRLRGTLNVKGPNPTSITDKAAIIRRALLLRDMICRKVPSIYNRETGIINISPALLSALLRTSEYRHGTRSLEFLLDMSRLSEAKRFTPSCLPMQDQLDIHVDFMDLSRKLAVERISGASIDKYVSKTHDFACKLRLELTAKRGDVTEEQLERIKQEPDMQPWDQLSEEYKESYRIRLRMLAEEMERMDFPLGIRLETKGLNDTVHALYGTTLDMMAKLDHEVWLQNMMETGWKYGTVEDKTIRISPVIRHYDQLTREEQERVQLRVLEVPKCLQHVGLELYRKSF